MEVAVQNNKVSAAIIPEPVDLSQSVLVTAGIIITIQYMYTCNALG